MARYTVKEHCQVVEKSLVQELERLWSIWNNKQYSVDQEKYLKRQIAYLLRLTNVWVSWKSGSLISEPLKIFNVSIYYTKCMYMHLLWLLCFWYEIFTVNLFTSYFASYFSYSSHSVDLFYPWWYNLVYLTLEQRKIHVPTCSVRKNEPQHNLKQK